MKTQNCLTLLCTFATAGLGAAVYLVLVTSPPGPSTLAQAPAVREESPLPDAARPPEPPAPAPLAEAPPAPHADAPPALEPRASEPRPSEPHAESPPGAPIRPSAVEPESARIDLAGDWQRRWANPEPRSEPQSTNPIPPPAPPEPYLQVSAQPPLPPQTNLRQPSLDPASPDSRSVVFRSQDAREAPRDDQSKLDRIAENRSGAPASANPVPNDAPSRGEDVVTQVFRAHYLTPQQLDALVRPLLTERVGAATFTSPAEMDSSRTASKGASRPTGPGLVVRDYPPVLAQIGHVVAEMDARPLKLAIEAMVLKVWLNEENRSGLDFSLLRQRKCLAPVAASGPEAGATPSLKSGLLEGNLVAFLDALDTLGRTSMVATPRLTVADRDQAELALCDTESPGGSADAKSAPSEALASDPASRVLLKPAISADGSIRLEIAAPMTLTSPAAAKAADASAGSKASEAVTTLIVPDGSTLVLGGLLHHAPGATAPRASLFDRIAAIRRSLPSKQAQPQPTCEIVVLLNPHVDRTADSPSKRKGAQALSFEQRKGVSERYLRAACQAVAAGNHNGASGLVEVALRFNPADRRATELRNRLWLEPASGSQMAAESPADPPMTASREGKLR